jgi:hypothetical protein
MKPKRRQSVSPKNQSDDFVQEVGSQLEAETSAESVPDFSGLLGNRLGQPPNIARSVAMLDKVKSPAARQQIFRSIGRTQGNRHAGEVAKIMRSRATLEPAPSQAESGSKPMRDDIVMSPSAAANNAEIPVFTETTAQEDWNWDNPQKSNSETSTSTSTTTHQGQGKKSVTEEFNDKKEITQSETRLGGIGKYEQTFDREKMVALGDKGYTVNHTWGTKTENGGWQNISYGKNVPTVAESRTNDWRHVTNVEADEKYGETSNIVTSETTKTGAGDRYSYERKHGPVTEVKTGLDVSKPGQFERDRIVKTQTGNDALFLGTNQTIESETIKTFKGGTKSSTELAIDEKLKYPALSNEDGKREWPAKKGEDGKWDWRNTKEKDFEAKTVTSESNGTSTSRTKYSSTSNTGYTGGIKGDYYHGRKQSVEYSYIEKNGKLPDKDDLKYKQQEAVIISGKIGDATKTNFSDGIHTSKDGDTYATHGFGTATNEGGSWKLTDRNLSADYTKTTRDGFMAEYGTKFGDKTKGSGFSGSFTADALAGTQESDAFTGKIGLDGVNAKYEHKAIDGVKAGVKGDVAFSAGGKTTDIFGNQQDLFAAKVKGQADVMAGARELRSAELNIDGHGAAVKLAASDFVGAEATGSIDGSLGFFGHDFFTAKAEGKAQAGAGADAALDVGIRDGKLNFKVGLSAAAGVGAGGSLEFSLNYKEARIAALSAINKAEEAAEAGIKKLPYGETFLKYAKPVAIVALRPFSKLLGYAAKIPDVLGAAKDWATKGLSDLMASNNAFGSAARGVRDFWSKYGADIWKWGGRIFTAAQYLYNPLKWVQTAIRGGIWAYRNWDTIKSTVGGWGTSAWNGIKGAASSVESGFNKAVAIIRSLRSAHAPFMPSLQSLSAAGTSLQAMAQSAAGRIGQTANGLIGAAQSKLDAARAKLNSAREMGLGFIADAGEFGLNAIEGLLARARSAAQAAQATAQTLVSTVSGVVSGAVAKAKAGWDKVQQMGESAANGIRGGWDKAKQLATSATQTVKSGWDKVQQTGAALGSRIKAGWDGLTQRAQAAWDGLTGRVNALRGENNQSATKIQSASGEYTAKNQAAAAKVEQSRQQIADQTATAKEQNAATLSAGTASADAAVNQHAQEGQQVMAAQSETLQAATVAAQQRIYGYGEKLAGRPEQQSEQYMAAVVAPKLEQIAAPHREHAENLAAEGQQSADQLIRQSAASGQAAVKQSELAVRASFAQIGAQEQHHAQLASETEKTGETEGCQRSQEAAAEGQNRQQAVAELTAERANVEQRVKSEKAALQGETEQAQAVYQSQAQAMREQTAAQSAQVQQEATATSEETAQKETQVQQEVVAAGQQTEAAQAEVNSQRTEVGQKEAGELEKLASAGR